MKNKYHEILVAYDGTNHAQTVLAEAVELAYRRVSSIMLLQVIEEKHASNEEKLVELNENYRARLENEVNRIKSQHAQITVDIQIVVGHPKIEIAKFCQQQKAYDLLVVGDTQKKLRSKLIESIPNYLIANVACNVLVVK